MSAEEIKAIEAKLRNLQNVDYSEWERSYITESINRPNKSRLNILHANHQRRIEEQAKASETKPKSVDLRGRPQLNRKECSTLCRHGEKKEKKEEKKKPKEGVISLLRVQIRARQKSLAECKQRFLTLCKENARLREALLKFESRTHEESKSLLDRYKKYRSAITIMASKHKEELDATEEDFNREELIIHKQLAELESEVERLDTIVEVEKESLKVLLNYKDKEYPERVEQIERLKHEIEILKDACAEDIQELDSIAEAEKRNYKHVVDVRMDDIKMKATDLAIENMRMDDKLMAMRNITMRKEIDFHRNEVSKTNSEIQCLENDIKELLELQDEEIERIKHPQLFAEKCHPDTEIVLRIPLQEWLPV